MKQASLFTGFVAVLLTTLLGCQDHRTLVPGEGFIPVTGGKVWYRVVGSGDKTPLLTLHGGPGIPGYYLKPLEALGKDRPVIFYHQLGCGKSDRITDTTLMTVEHYVEELKQVIDYFGLQDYYLYGQSWGTMLGTDFYLAHPEGVTALILSSPALSVPMWAKDADTLIASLPDSVQMAIRVNEQNKTFGDPAYLKAVEMYYHNFLARKLPWSADTDSSFSQLGANVYGLMAGPSEFTITGSLKSYDRTNRLKEIKVPTLFITGEYDEARPSTVKYYQSLVPDSRLMVIEDAGHLTMQDNPQQDIAAISAFLDGLETESQKIKG